MVGHQWLPWINNPTSSSVSVTSAKQEQETSSGFLCTRTNMSCHRLCPVVGLSALCLLLLVACVALSVLYHSESDSRPEWRSLLFDYQNISDSYITLTETNSDLRGDNDVLKEHSAWLDEQAKLLNKTSAKLMSANLALSLESAELMEQIVNLTSTNLKLSQEHERLVQLTSEQEEEKLNMSQTIKHLVESDSLREQEEQRLAEINGLLMDELAQVKEKNQELQEINEKFQREVKHLREQTDDCEEKHDLQLQQRVTELQEQNQNLSSTLMTERQEAAEREDSRRTETERIKSLNLYCPVVNHKTKGFFVRFKNGEMEQIMLDLELKNAMQKREEKKRVCRKCPDSWRPFENKCYYFSSRMLTWSSSRAWCQTQGGDLLIINSEPEQRFISESSQTEDQSSSRLWIGLTDADEEGRWFWVDGSSVTAHVQFWLSRPGMETEPDDWKLDDPLGEDCGHIDTSEDVLMSWMDGSCKTTYRWICEKNV